MREPKPNSGELLQGTLDMLILKTLIRGPMHGYGVGALGGWGLWRDGIFHLRSGSRNRHPDGAGRSPWTGVGDAFEKRHAERARGTGGRVDSGMGIGARDAVLWMGSKGRGWNGVRGCAAVADWRSGARDCDTGRAGDPDRPGQGAA